MTDEEMAKECFFVAYGGHWITLKKSEKWAYTEKKFSRFLDAFDFFQTALAPKYIGHISETGFKSEITEKGIEELLKEDEKIPLSISELRGVAGFAGGL